MTQPQSASESVVACFTLCLPAGSSAHDAISRVDAQLAAAGIADRVDAIYSDGTGSCGDSDDVLYTVKARFTSAATSKAEAEAEVTRLIAAAVFQDEPEVPSPAQQSA